MEEKISFGVWLHKQRRALDLSRQAFADQVGCAEVTLRRIEAGTLKPSKELASILLEKLGVSEAEWPQWISFARGLSDLPGQSPALSNKPTSNLPTPLTTFIGRENEQAEVISLITKHRLVTLTGPGGVGKTRLAINVVTDVLKRFSDGVWFFDLSPLSDPELVPSTLAGLLELRESKELSITDILINYLHSRTVLIVFDNCEHVIEASARLVHSLLSACQHLSILATSREALRVSGEIHFPVPSLDIPRPNTELTTDEISNLDSVKLFTDRAAAASPGFVISQRNAPIISQICQRLDGVPLALELAAARADVLAVEQILKRLDDRFNLLTRGLRTALPRHQTLRATIDWSYDLLTEPEQSLFRRLPVFAGGFTIEAAEAICGHAGLKPNDILDLLERLVDKSLVNVEQVITTGDTRYRLLETIREYLVIRLQESIETSMLREAHLKYFTKFAEEIAPKLFSHGQTLWFARLEIEMDNLRAALDWSISDVSENASEFPNDFIHLSKFRQRIELCKQLGEVLNGQAKYTEAVEVYKLMLKSAQDSGELVAQSQALQGLAISLADQGDNLASLDFAIQAETLARRADARLALATALRIQGIARYRLGELQVASLLGEQAFSLATEMQDRDETARSLNLLGASTYLLGKYDSAKIYWQMALSIFQGLGNHRFGMDIMSNLGAIADAQGDYETAFRYYQDAWEIAHRVGYRDGEIVFLSNRGIEQIELKNYVAAEADLRKAIELASTAGSWCMPNTHAFLAQACLGQGNNAKALEEALHALILAQDSNTPEYIGVAWRVLGMISAPMGEPIHIKSKETSQSTGFDSRNCFRISEEIFAKNGIDGERARTLREWARYELLLGDKEHGVAMWHEARKVFEELGAHLEVERMATIPQ